MSNIIFFLLGFIIGFLVCQFCVLFEMIFKPKIVEKLQNKVSGFKKERGAIIFSGGDQETIRKINIERADKDEKSLYIEDVL